MHACSHQPMYIYMTPYAHAHAHTEIMQPSPATQPNPTQHSTMFRYTCMQTRIRARLLFTVGCCLSFHMPFAINLFGAPGKNGSVGRQRGLAGRTLPLHAALATRDHASPEAFALRARLLLPCSRGSGAGQPLDHINQHANGPAVAAKPLKHCHGCSVVTRCHAWWRACRMHEAL